ncbi:MAG: hypothetical protein IT497_04365 [Ottowia sp.]|nr:hypothetical protein [Ottowia sp.]
MHMIKREIEIMRLIRKGQLCCPGNTTSSTAQQFSSLCRLTRFLEEKSCAFSSLLRQYRFPCIVQFLKLGKVFRVTALIRMTF